MVAVGCGSDLGLRILVDSSSYGPCEGGRVLKGARKPECVSHFGKQKTVESELARTRGIQLSN